MGLKTVRKRQRTGTRVTQKPKKIPRRPEHADGGVGAVWRDAATLQSNYDQLGLKMNVNMKRRMVVDETVGAMKCMALYCFACTFAFAFVLFPPVISSHCCVCDVRVSSSSHERYLVLILSSADGAH